MDFHALFDAQYVPVHRYLAHRLGDAAAAEDLAAETFLRAYAARASFAPAARARGCSRSPPTCSATTPAARAGAMWRSPEWAGRSARAVEPEFELPDPELALALAALRVEEREALLLYAWADLSYDEIASVTGVAVGTVRSRLARARARLTAELAPERSPK